MFYVKLLDKPWETLENAPLKAKRRAGAPTPGSVASATTVSVDAPAFTFPVIWAVVPR